MSVWTSATSRFTLSWVATYTLGLASHVRESRRLEINSDLWEQQHDAAREGQNARGTALHILSRTLRGAPADLFWRINMEGPNMDIRIPFERIAGGLMLAMVVLMMITVAISGYDTSAQGFDGELRRLADLSPMAENGNAFFRIAAGLGLIAASAGFYLTLRERSPFLATVVAFALLAAAILELIASSLQMVFVELANEYVAAAPGDQPQLLTSARTVAIAVSNVTWCAMLALLLSVYVLAVLAGREALVPRWMISVPIVSAGLLFGGLIASGAGVDGTWVAVVGGAFIGILWLVMAGFWLIFTPREHAPTANPLPASA